MRTDVATVKNAGIFASLCFAFTREDIRSIKNVQRAYILPLIFGILA